MPSGRPRPLLAIGVGGFLAGLFDITFALPIALSVRYFGSRSRAGG